MDMIEKNRLKVFQNTLATVKLTKKMSYGRDEEGNQIKSMYQESQRLPQERKGGKNNTPQSWEAAWKTIPCSGLRYKRHSVETSPLVHTNLGNKSTFITIMYFRHFKTKRKKKKKKKICPVAVISVMLGKSTMCWCFWDAPTNPDIWNPQKNCHCNETESHL